MSTRLGTAWDEVDERVGDSPSELLAVSQAHGVVPRSRIAASPPRADDFSRYKSCCSGDLVLNRFNAYRGALGVAPVAGMVSPDYLVLRPRGTADARYLDYLLRSHYAASEMTKYMGGIGGNDPDTSGFARIDVRALNRMEVPERGTVDQRAIADYLDRETARIDTLIEEQWRLIEILRERRDGVVTKTFLNSTSEERALKFAVDDVTVGIVIQPSRWYVDTGVPALRGVNVKRGSISLIELVSISEEGHAAHSKSRLCAGDVVVVRTGQAGAAAKIPDELDGANAIDILIVRPGQCTDPDFLVWYLNSPLAASRIEQGSVGALQGHFNVSALRELPLPNVPVAEQQRIVAYLDERIAKIDMTIAETKRFIELSKERRAALITAAVTVQIDVREMV